jgi:ATP-binding cassette, sub-family E, member 1
MCIKRCPFQAI